MSVQPPTGYTYYNTLGANGMTNADGASVLLADTNGNALYCIGTGLYGYK